MEVYVDDETKLTLHGLQQYYVKLKDNEKNRKLFDLLDILEFNQVIKKEFLYNCKNWMFDYCLGLKPVPYSTHVRLSLQAPNAIVWPEIQFEFVKFWGKCVQRFTELLF